MFQVSQPHAKCSKISNTYFFLLSTKMLVIKAGIHNMLSE